MTLTSGCKDELRLKELQPLGKLWKFMNWKFTLKKDIVMHNANTKAQVRWYPQRLIKKICGAFAHKFTKHKVGKS